MTLKLLITGFGSFPGALTNPSAALVARLARRPNLPAVETVAHVFATSYATVAREMPELLERHRPDALIMFGLAGRTPYLRIETQARNRMSLSFPDVDGFKPPGHEIVSGAAAAMSGRAPFRQMLAATHRARVNSRLSRDAGRYLCNYAYWRALEASRRSGRPRIVAFAHIPKIVSSAPRHGRLPAITFSRLTEAGEAIIVATIKALRR